MIRTAAIRTNGAATNGRCQQCGFFVTIQHGTMPGETFQRHYYECANCHKRGLLYPLYDCPHCREQGEGVTIVLITSLGVDCVWGMTGGQPPKRAERMVQLSLF